MSLEDGTRFCCCDRGQKESRRRAGAERGLRLPSPHRRACWLSPVKFGSSESTQSLSATNAVELARTTSAHVSGMRQYLQCSITRATEMRVTSEQSCIALRTFLTLPSMLSFAPFGEHRDGVWTSKNISEPQEDDRELAHTQLQLTGPQYHK